MKSHAHTEAARRERTPEDVENAAFWENKAGARAEDREADMREAERAMKHCILCGTLTAGSVGAAGLRWSCICQPCKDEEDGALLAGIRAQAAITKLVTT